MGLHLTTSRSEKPMLFSVQKKLSSQTLILNFAAGATEEVSLTADFIDNRTYYINTELTNPVDSIMQTPQMTR